MPQDFAVARNPEDGSSLPYLLRIPLGREGIVLKARESWPRTGKVYCHRAVGWPADPDLVETVPTRSCVRRGAAIDLVLDRQRENRSQFVLTRVRGGREAIFWQTARTTKQARPGGRIPTARSFGVSDLEIVIDDRERYAWKFEHQQVSTRRARLATGDYGVLNGRRLQSVVERKSLPDLASTLTSGRMRYLLADLAALPAAAVVVEDRYSQVFRLEHVRPAVVADALAECQVRFANVPIIFAETRALAQEWSYRFLAATVTHGHEDAEADLRIATMSTHEQPAPAEVRAWARRHGLPVSDRGRLSATVLAAYARRSAE